MTGGGPADVMIRFGAVPDALVSSAAKGDGWQAAQGQFLFRLKDIAAYLIQNGREIIIDPAPGADENDVRLFLLGSAMGALLHQRGFLPLHASAVDRPDGSAALIAGGSGVGKSTLAAALRKRGFSVIADDVSVLTSDPRGIPVIIPGYPEIRLWADAVEIVGENPASLPKSRSKLKKFSLRFPDEFKDGPRTVSRVYVLEAADRGDFEIETLCGPEKFAVLVRHTYRLPFVEAMGLKSAHFELCAAVAKHATIKRIIRPARRFLLEGLASFLEEDLG
jgi:hypothetical protein